MLLLLLACSSSPYDDCKACCWEKEHEGVSGFVADELDAVERVKAGDACRAACVEDVQHCE